MSFFQSKRNYKTTDKQEDYVVKVLRRSDFPIHYS